MDPEALDGLERISFGASCEMADSLLALVLNGTKTATCWNGTKTATCWAARHGQLTRVGKRAIACDGAGRARAILETTSLERRRFCDVGEGFARAEGEGDLSLASWRQAHRNFFEKEGGFSEEMELWCERFRVVTLLSEAVRPSGPARSA